MTDMPSLVQRSPTGVGHGRHSTVHHRSRWDWSISVPLSQGWRCGPFVFVGGQISADGHGRTIGVGDIEVQTRNVFNNVRTVLNEAGADMRQLVKFNTYYVFEGEGDEIREYWEKMTAVAHPLTV